MELYVAVLSQYGTWPLLRKSETLHKGVRYRHGCNDHNVHKQRDDNNALIEANKTIILGEAIADKVRFDGLQEIPVKCSINKEVQDFLYTVPILVDDVIS